MKKEKGVLGKLLSIAGVILVIVGVFVFQGMSKAEDDGAPATGGDVNLSIPTELDGEPEGTAEGDAEGGEEAGESTGEGEEEPEAPTIYNYTVKYFVSDEEDAEPVEIQEGTSLETEYVFEILGVEPESDKGDFLGWYEIDNEKVGEYLHKDDKLALNSDKLEIKLMAKFAKLENYAMRYSANGGAGAPATQLCQSYFGTCDFVLSASVPVREGYEFKGWTINGDESKIYAPGSTIKSVLAEETLTLFASWAEIKTYTLMYDVAGGTGSPEVQACKSASGACKFAITEVAPHKTGYTFDGWQRGEESYTAGMEIIVTETNTILAAKWNPVYNFTLTYTAEEGTENLPEPQKCETTMGSCTFIVSTKEPTREGYIFLGWRWPDKEDMKAKGGDELVVAIDGALDLKIMAVWSRVYQVLNSGEVFGAGERVVLRSSANHQNFQKLIVDQEEVPAEYYAISETDSTSIIFSNAFAQSLNSGEHGFTIVWSDGEANGIISVNQNEDGTKRFVIVDAMGNTAANGLMYRPKAGAVSKESSGVTADAATGNEESNFDAVRILILVAVATFVVIYVINRFYIRRKMDFIEEF